MIGVIAVAKTFTSKEAKQLIQEHKSLLKTLDALAELPMTVQHEVRTAASLLTDRIDHIISLEVESNPANSMHLADAAQFISALYYYRKMSLIVSSAMHCREIHKSQIQRSVLLLSPGTSAFQWLFANAAIKNSANEEYLSLQNLIAGNYAQSIHSMKEETSALRNTPFSVIEADFSAHREEYENLYHRLTEKKYSTKDRSRPLSHLIKKHDELNKKVTECDSGVTTDHQKIKDAALKLAASESLSLLQSVPVEELNRDRSGIRVKTLREHGYSTIADVYAASVYQLESIHGISEDGAYTIKQMAHVFAEQAKNNAKIRLSTDHRTKDATNLVSSIYGYRLRNETRQALRSFVSTHAKSITHSKKTVQQLENAVDWLFYSEQQKEEIRDAYSVLKQHISGEYAQKVNQYISNLNPNKFHSSDKAWKDFSENSIAYFNILESIVPGILGNDDSLYGLPEDLAREIQEQEFFPDGLLCELRRYQEWGVKYALHQERILLGDEMGLGKTVQAIATMVSLRNTGATHFMVVCPASVLTNWCREIRKMSRLSVTKIHGYDRSTAAQSWLKTGGVAVTTYETTGHILLENDFQFSMLVVDEAHYVKNPDAQRTINVQNISKHAERLLFMTGTALENKVDEMISLIKMLQPAVADSVRGMEFLSSAPQFRKNVAPVYYRRKREDVLTELPDLIENREWCTMTAAEEAVYEDAVLEKRYGDARRVSWNVDNLKESSKAARMMELIADAMAEGRKVIVFSFFLDTIRKVTTLVDDRCYGPINGSVSPQRRQEIIDQFDKAPAGSVLAAQIQAGGTGLNIQSASVVIICEPQFKPSIENQAISRAYRMGQTRNVLVYRLLCEDTVDERITSILESKQEIFDAFADKSDAAIKSFELDDKTFGNIIKEEIDRINAKRGHVASTS